MYAEELNSGESSATLWSTRPTWDFGTKACGFSRVFVTTGHRVCDALPSRPAFPRAVCIVSCRPWSVATATRNPGSGKPKTAGSEQNPRSSRRNLLPVEFIHGSLMMRHEHLPCALVELMQIGKTPSGTDRILQHAPEAFNGVEVMATMGR